MIYNSQRDPKWRNVQIGKSPVTVGSHGCTITSISMGGTWYGEYRTPGELAQTLSFTPDGRILWASIARVYRTMRFLWREYKNNQPMFAEALKNKDKVLLLNVDRGYHWVFARYAIPFVGYMTQDPWPYPTRTRIVRHSEVVGGAILIRK
jgi:hypothetical protein